MKSTNIKRCAHYYRSPKDRKRLTSDYKAKNQVPGIVLNAIHVFLPITLRLTQRQALLSHFKAMEQTHQGTPPDITELGLKSRQCESHTCAHNTTTDLPVYLLPLAAWKVPLIFQCSSSIFSLKAVTPFPLSPSLGS